MTNQCRMSTFKLHSIYAPNHSKHNDGTLIVGALVSASGHALIVILSFKKEIKFLINTLKHGGYIMAVISLALIMYYEFLLDSYILFCSPHITACI